MFTKNRIKQFLVVTFGVLLSLVPIYGAINFPNYVEQTDFVPIFYTAGLMAKEGKEKDIYPSRNDTTFLEAPFTEYAHTIFKHLPAKVRPFFQYPPLFAFLLEPISSIPLPAALIVWQILSIVAVFFCSKFLSLLINKNPGLYFFSSLLYFPIFHTLYIGQVGLILVLLPGSLGYFLLMKKRPLLAGLTWSLILLKPQFLPMVFLVITSLLMLKKFRCAGGFVAGSFAVIIGNIVCFGMKVMESWISSIKLSNAPVTDPALVYTYGKHLVSSLPVAAVQNLPYDWRTPVQWMIYVLGFVIICHALLLCKKVNECIEDKNEAVSIILVIGISILPLISPHLFFYDLSIFILVGMIIFGGLAFSKYPNLTKDLWLMWILIDLYLFISIIKTSLAQPLILVAIFIWFYWRILVTVQKEIADQKPALE